MYFPYVFGRQYDLIALNQVAAKVSKKKVVTPIIEPVNSNPGDLIRALTNQFANGLPTIVIVNPHLGKFKNASSVAIATWNAELDKINSNPLFIPALKLTALVSESDITNFLKKHSGKVAFIHWAERDASKFSHTISSDLARTTQIFVHNHTSSAYRKAVPGAEKVICRDGFNKQARNADYDANEYFDDLISTYKSENMDGFADFTITGSEFVEGGGPASAVTIHLTHQNTSSKDLWMLHFVSDDTTRPPNDSNLKIGQSLRKLNAHVTTHPGQFSFSDAVKKFQAILHSGQKTSLGKLKQFSIEHHIETIDHLANC
jgi:hypothetical protein